MGSFRNSPSSARVNMLYKIALLIKERGDFLWNAVERGDTWAFPLASEGSGCRGIKLPCVLTNTAPIFPFRATATAASPNGSATSLPNANCNKAF